MTEQEIQQQKDIEFYAAAVEAWLGTSLEHDKSLLTLSAGGIGLLITLLSTVGLHSAESLILYIVALFAFFCCLIAILWIFKRNRFHLEEAIRDGKTSTDRGLAVLDAVAIASFLFGAVLSAIIGIAAAVHSFQTQETPMSKEDKGRHHANDSVNGILNMRPAQASTPASVDPLTKSFNGITNMRPAPQEPVATPTQTTQPATVAPVAPGGKPTP
jgi:hypothetical protein